MREKDCFGDMALLPSASGSDVFDLVTEYAAEDINFDALIDEKRIQNSIFELMSSDILNEQEKEVLIYYYGLGGKRQYTLEEIASILGVTRYVIEGIKRRAFKKIRNSPMFLELLIYAQKDTVQEALRNKIVQLQEEVAKKCQDVVRANRYLNELFEIQEELGSLLERESNMRHIIRRLQVIAWGIK